MIKNYFNKLDLTNKVAVVFGGLGQTSQNIVDRFHLIAFNGVRKYNYTVRV